MLPAHAGHVLGSHASLERSALTASSLQLTAWSPGPRAPAAADAAADDAHGQPLSSLEALGRRLTDNRLHFSGFVFSHPFERITKREKRRGKSLPSGIVSRSDHSNNNNNNYNIC